MQIYKNNLFLFFLCLFSGEQKKTMKSIFLVFLFLLSVSTTATQLNDKKDSIYYAIEAKFQYGFAVPHHDDMFYNINEYTKSGEINIVRRRYKSNFWESDVRRMETGIGFWFSTLGRNDIYGYGFSAFPFINLHIFQLGKLSAKFRVALGLGYATKPFNKFSNPYNNVFGSHLNAYIGFGFMLYYPVTEKLSIAGGVSLNHLSNGAVQKPNNGMNTVGLTIGARYDLTDLVEKNLLVKIGDKKSAKLCFCR